MHDEQDNVHAFFACSCPCSCTPGITVSMFAEEPRETVLQAAGQAGSQKQGLPPPNCKCGEPATERVSWTLKNPERKFYKCSQPQVSLVPGVLVCSAVMCHSHL